MKTAKVVERFMYTERLRAVVRLLFVVTLCGGMLAAQAPETGSKQSSSPEIIPQQRRGYFEMATAIGDDYFDGRDSVERVRRHLKTARAAGVRYLRCGFSWNGIEPERGQYQFEFWDMLVAEAGRSGIKLIPYVAYTPKWAARTEEGFWKQPPTDAAEYARVMRTLAERYRGKITHWELWNEPDNKEYWDGSPELFAETMIAAANAVREVAPEDVLVLGGMSQGPGSFFDVLINRYHLERYVDVLALHAYPESWHEERAETTFGPWVEQMHAVAQRSGRKLWLNEMGYADYRYQPNHASLWGTNTYYSYEHTSRYAAEFLFKSFVMTLGTGEVALAGWYRIDDFRENDTRMPPDKVHYHLGIMDVEGWRKPAFYALRFFNSLLGGAVRRFDVPEEPGSKAEVRVFQRKKDGRVVVAGWIRSSRYDEVTVHSGTALDERREAVDVPLPCTAARVSTFDVTGKRVETHYPRRRMLRRVPLRGDRVYVAEVTCAGRRDGRAKSPR